MKNPSFNRDQAGHQYNIEVQLDPGAGDYKGRSIYYTAKFFCDQLNRGEPYHTLDRTVSISILDFNLFKDTQELHSAFRFWEPTQGFALSDLLELHYIELRKFSPTKPAQLRTRFEKWLFVLKFADIYNSPDDQPLPDCLAQEEGISMAIDSMRKAYAQDEVRELIEARLKAEHDEASRRYQAELEGRRKGLEEGLQDGLQKGLQKAAQAMLLAGYQKDEIQKLTGLDPDELAEK